MFHSYTFFPLQVCITFFYKINRKGKAALTYKLPVPVLTQSWYTWALLRVPGVPTHRVQEAVVPSHLPRGSRYPLSSPHPRVPLLSSPGGFTSVRALEAVEGSGEEGSAHSRTEGRREDLWIPEPCFKPVPGSALFQPHVPHEVKPRPLIMTVKLLHGWTVFPTSPHSKLCHTKQNISYSLLPKSSYLRYLCFPHSCSLKLPSHPKFQPFLSQYPKIEALFSYSSCKTLFTCHPIQKVSDVASSKKGSLSLF